MSRGVIIAIKNYYLGVDRLCSKISVTLSVAINDYSQILTLSYFNNGSLFFKD